MQRNNRHYRSLMLVLVFAVVFGWWLAVMTIIATMASVRIVQSTLHTQQTTESRLLFQPECNNMKSGSSRNAYELKYYFKCCCVATHWTASLRRFYRRSLRISFVFCCWMSSKELLLSLLLSALFPRNCHCVTIFTLTNRVEHCVAVCALYQSQFSIEFRCSQCACGRTHTPMSHNLRILNKIQK